MHCVQFEMRLNELLDERSSPDADMELVEHARDCSDCADLLAGHGLLLDGVEELQSYYETLGAMPTRAPAPAGRRGHEPHRGMATQSSGHGTRQFSIEVPREIPVSPDRGADFAVRVAAELAGSRRPPWRSWIWSVPAVAAAGLVAVGLWRVLTPVGHEVHPTVTVTPSADLPGVVRNFNDRYFRYYGSQAAAMTEELRGRRIEWVEQMADGLKPVADSMSAALHALRRTLPGGDAPVRSSAEPLPLSRIAAIA